MFYVKDEVTGEILGFGSRKKAITEAKKRVERHNSEFHYRHRGVHLPEDVEIVFENNANCLVIRRKMRNNPVGEK